jgi:hypothetical protein
MQDHGNWICAIKDLNEQHWEHAIRYLQLYHSTNWWLIYEDINVFGRSGDTCDTKLVSNIFYEYVDVDERKESPRIHDGNKTKIWDNCSSWILEGIESPMSVVHFYVWVCFVYLGLWCLKFAIQWKWTSKLILVMEWVCCYNWVGSWMRNVDHIVEEWLVLEIGWRQMRTDNGL